jgi:hypothetical protein
MGKQNNGERLHRKSLGCRDYGDWKVARDRRGIDYSQAQNNLVWGRKHGSLRIALPKTHATRHLAASLVNTKHD